MRKTSILIIILMVLSTLICSYGSFETLCGLSTYIIANDKFAIKSYSLLLFKYVIIGLCVLVYGIILIRVTSGSKYQSIEATIRAKIELKKEEIKTKKSERLAERHASQKAKLQEKLNKLNNEENE